MVLNLIFGFLLNFPPVVAVLIFSVFVLVLINIFYKLLINQAEARQVKERTKELGNQMREEQKKGNTQRSTELMGEMMRENSRLMRMSLKPMVISLIIVIILLPFLADNYGDRFAEIKNDAGNIEINGAIYELEKSGNTLSISSANQVNCGLPCSEKLGGVLFEISEEGQKIKFAPVVALLPVTLPVAGSTLGWLGWYILVSVPLIILIRKFMKIYV